MSVREKYPFQSDSVIEFLHPTDEVAENALDNTGDGSTCSFKVYDPAKDEVLSTAAVAFDLILFVVNAGAFVIGDTIELSLDDGSLHIQALTDVDATAGTVTIGLGLPSVAAKGNRIRVVFGTTVNMTEFGTPVFGKRDYGFRGTLPDDHPVQILDQEFDIEVRFVGSTGGGLDALDVLCGVIKPRGECE